MRKEHLSHFQPHLRNPHVPLPQHISIPWSQFPNHFARVNNCQCVVTQGHRQWRNVIRIFIPDLLGSWLAADTCFSDPLHVLPTPCPLSPDSLGGDGESYSRADANVAFLCSFPMDVGRQSIMLQGAGTLAVTPGAPGLQHVSALQASLHGVI